MLSNNATAVTGMHMCIGCNTAVCGTCADKFSGPIGTFRCLVCTMAGRTGASAAGDLGELGTADNAIDDKTIVVIRVRKDETAKVQLNGVSGREEIFSGANGTVVTGRLVDTNEPVVVKLSVIPRQLPYSKMRPYIASMFDDFAHPATDALAAASLGLYERHQSPDNPRPADLTGLCGVLFSGPMWPETAGAPLGLYQPYATVMRAVGTAIEKYVPKEYGSWKVPDAPVPMIVDGAQVTQHVLLYALLHAVRLEYALVEHGVMHMDMHPGNIMLQYRDGRWFVSVIDLGLLSPVREDAWSIRAWTTVYERKQKEKRGVFRSPAFSVLTDTLDMFLLIAERLGERHKFMQETEDSGANRENAIIMTAIRSIDQQITLFHGRKGNNIHASIVNPSQRTRKNSNDFTESVFSREIGFFGRDAGATGELTANPGRLNAYKTQLQEIEKTLVRAWNDGRDRHGNGVGTQLTPVYVQTRGGMFVAPDRGDGNSVPIPLGEREQCRLRRA